MQEMNARLRRLERNAMIWRLCTGVIVLVLLFLGCSNERDKPEQSIAATQHTSATRSMPDLPEDAPMLLVYRASSRKRSSYVRTQRSGLEIAIWMDGFVLFAPDSEDLSGSLRTGHLEPLKVRSVIEQIESTGFFDQPATSLCVPDGDVVHIYARYDGKRNLQGWNGIEYRGHRQFQTMWKTARQLIETCRPSVSKAAGDAADEAQSIRGYHLDAPQRAAWLNTRLWYAK